MNIYDQAADAIEREVIRVEGLQAAGKVLKELGSLENARIEATQGTAKARAASDAAVADLGKAKRQIEEAQQSADKIVEDAKAEAGKVVAVADSYAVQTKANATAEAKQIRDTEVQTREAALRGLNDQIGRATKAVEDAEAAATAAREDAAAADTLRVEAEKGLASIQAQIESLSVRR